MNQLGSWSIRTPTSFSVTAATARLAIQYAASSSNTAEILYFKISQNASNTAAQDSVSVVRLTAGATVTTGAVGTNIFDLTANTTGGAVGFHGTLSTSATGVNATTAGTVGDVTWQRDFNVLGPGYEWNSQPDNRLWVPVSGIIGIRCDAITSQAWNVELHIREYK